MVSISFQPRPGSHPFNDRECTVVPNEQIKVGRAVAKAKPSPSNFIFDCKVLSRNHALVWLNDGEVSLVLCHSYVSSFAIEF